MTENWKPRGCPFVHACLTQPCGSVSPIRRVVLGWIFCSHKSFYKVCADLLFRGMRCYGHVADFQILHALLSLRPDGRKVTEAALVACVTSSGWVLGRGKSWLRRHLHSSFPKLGHGYKNYLLVGVSRHGWVGYFFFFIKLCTTKW